CRVLASPALAEDSVATGLVRGVFAHRGRRVGAQSPPEALAEPQPEAGGARRLSGRQPAARQSVFEKLVLARVSDLVKEEIHPGAHGCCISFPSHPPPSAL